MIIVNMMINNTIIIDMMITWGRVLHREVGSTKTRLPPTFHNCQPSTMQRWETRRIVNHHLFGIWYVVHAGGFIKKIGKIERDCLTLTVFIFLMLPPGLSICLVASCRGLEKQVICWELGAPGGGGGGGGPPSCDSLGGADGGGGGATTNGGADEDDEWA